MCLEGQGEGSELINHQQWTELGPRAKGPWAQGRGFPWSKQAPPTETKAGAAG